MAGLAIVLTVWMGSLLATQVGVNGLLRERTGSAIHAAMISTAVSTTSLLIVNVIRGEAWPPLPDLAHMPWWLWTGGLMGALYVALAPVLAVRMGGAVFFAIVLVGQMTAALIFDQFGLLGLPQHDISLPRVAGALMLVAGVVLIRWF
jgi:transporter family-2 protein